MDVSVQFYMDLSQFIWANANKNLQIVRLKGKEHKFMKQINSKTYI